MTRLAEPSEAVKRTPSTVLVASASIGSASEGTAPRMPSIAAKSAATSISSTASTIVSPGLVSVIRSCRPASMKRTRVTCRAPALYSNVAALSSAWRPIARGSSPSTRTRNRDRMRVSPSHRPSPANSPGRIDPSLAETVKKRSRLSITRSEMS